MEISGTHYNGDVFFKLSMIVGRETISRVKLDAEVRRALFTRVRLLNKARNLRDVE